METEDLIALIGTHLPDGLTSDDLLAAQSATLAQLAECLRRIEIIGQLAAREIGIADVIKSGAYGRTLLYQLQRRWNAGPSLRAVLPYARRDPARAPRRSDKRLSAAYAAAAEAEAADPSSSVGAVAWRLAKGIDVGFTTLRSMAWQARQRRLGKLIPIGDPEWRPRPRVRHGRQT